MIINKIRVMHVISSLKRGGIEIFLLNLIKNTDRKYFDMNICCIGQNGPMAEAYEKLGSRVFLLTYTKSNILSFIIKLRKLFIKEKVDIVHSHLGSLTFWIALAARLAGVRIVVSTFHNTYKYKPFLKHYFYIRLSQGLIDKQFVVSYAVQHWLEQLYGVCRSEVLYLGVDTNRFDKSKYLNLKNLRRQLDIPEHTIVVGTVGNCTYQKDHTTFLRMAQEIIRKYDNNIKFLIIGEGPLHMELVELSKTLNISDKVIFTGAREDIPQLMALMDVFVLTSRWEGLGIVLLEAQSMGLPIVASRIP